MGGCYGTGCKGCHCCQFKVRSKTGGINTAWIQHLIELHCEHLSKQMDSIIYSSTEPQAATSARNFALAKASHLEKDERCELRVLNKWGFPCRSSTKGTKSTQGSEQQVQGCHLSMSSALHPSVCPWQPTLMQTPVGRRGAWSPPQKLFMSN